MADQGDRHVACVNAWLDRAKGLPPTPLLDAFEEAFDAIWARAHRSLGDVTLTAIVDRVLCTASETFPTLGTIQAEPGQLLSREFRAHAARLPPEERVDAIRFALVELLSVLGNLTAEILTPALHAELSKVGDQQGRRLRSSGTHKKHSPRSSKTGKP